MEVLHIINRMTLKAFLLYFLCLCLPLSVLLSAITYDRIDKERTKYYTSVNDMANSTVESLNEKMYVIVNIANSIFLSRWYGHFRNKLGIYNDEYDTLKRMEISEDLRIKTISMDFVSDILVITPALDSVISKKGWYTIRDYENFYGTISIGIDTYTNSNNPIVKSANDKYCTIILSDINSRQDNSIICILIDKTSFAKYFQRMQNELIRHINIKIDGQQLYYYGSNENGYSISVRNITPYYLTLDMTYSDYDEILLPERIYRFIMQLIIVILSSIVLALILTVINIRPLNVLLKRFSGVKYRSTVDAYKYISDFVDNISYKNLQLKDENKSLNASVLNFFSVMHNEIMFSMLTNPDFDFSDEYICNNIPWINDNFPFVMALIETKSSQFEYDISSLLFPEDSFYYFSSFKILESERCMIFWFSDTQSAESQCEIIRSVIAKELSGEYFFELSDIMYKPEDMRECYLLQKHNISMQKQVSLDLPISLQIELITKIKSNRFEECYQLINESKQIYKPESFLLLLLRIAHEYDINPGNALTLYKRHLDAHHYTKLWGVIISFMGDIITTICMSKRQRSAETANMIREFIDTNYSNPNMSIKLLSEKFELDGTLISKIFKAEMGITFTDYLLEQRMKLALKLLENSEMSLTTISETVGYIHYLTFKRAFVRFKGLTPKEYRELELMGM